MRILHINSYYSGSNFYKNLYDEQKKSGLDIAVYVPVSKAIDTSRLKLGDYTTLSANHGKYHRLLFNLKHKKIYKDIVKKYAFKQYSIIHAHSLFSNGYIALKLKEAFDTPYIVTVRNTDVNIFFKYMFHMRKLGIKILRESKKVIFLSESYRSKVLEKYIPFKLRKEIFDKTVIIPNGIDNFWFQNKESTKIYSSDKKLKLLQVGVINKNKNLIRTVKATEILQKKGYEVKLTVVGKIGDKSIYKQIVKKPYINYVPPIHKEELLSIYRDNDIFVMPSISETFGLVYAESMSQGLPVIYTHGQGFDGQFEEGKVGFHVGYDDIGDIADKIQKIVQKYEEISSNCVKLCEKFDWYVISKEYMMIYKEIYNEKK